MSAAGPVRRRPRFLHWSISAWLRIPRFSNATMDAGHENTGAVDLDRPAVQKL